MELLLRLTRLRGYTLPVNYQYALSSWIYRAISRADNSYSSFMHNDGFSCEDRRFKFFTFSQLDLRPYRLAGDRIQLFGNDVRLIVRFLMDTGSSLFMKGLFMERFFSLGDKNSQVHFKVNAIEIKPPPLFTHTRQYECLSPVVVSASRSDGTTAYLSPDDPCFGTILLQNLMRKHNALSLQQSDEGLITRGSVLHSFRILNDARKKGITIKEGRKDESKVIGYLFRFELTAPAELHEVGYYAGVGEKNAMGFGCIGTREL